MSDETYQILRNAIGRTVEAIKIILYRGPDGSVEDDDVQVEYHLSGGVMLRLSGASDGESVCVQSDRWVDPFEEPLCATNRAYVATHGKWCSYGLAQSPFESTLPGQNVAEFLGLTNEFGTMAGIMLVAASESAWYYVETDEGKLGFGPEWPTNGIAGLSVRGIGLDCPVD